VLDKMTENLETELQDFIAVYSTRPINDNSGGMGFNHSFAFWRLLRILKPELIVESGIWKGHSTWLIEVALPESRIIAFDIKLSKREYISSRVKYIESDFQFYDWSSEDLEKSLILLDDHQNSFNRILLANFFGMKRMIFEDNYLADNGDFYSLNHIFSKVGFPDIQLSRKHRKSLRSFLMRALYLPVLQRVGSHQHWLVPANPFDSNNLQSKLVEYQIFPRIFDEHGQVTGEFSNTLLNFTLPNNLGKTHYSYNQITYLEIK